MSSEAEMVERMVAAVKAANKAHAECEEAYGALLEAGYWVSVTIPTLELDTPRTDDMYKLHGIERHVKVSVPV